MNHRRRCLLLLGIGLAAIGGPVFLSEAQTEPASFRFEEREGKYLDLYDGDRPVLTYVHGMNLAPGVPEHRERSSYIHPLYGVDGEVLTDDFPKDHYHHRGVFWAWQQILWNGQNLSLWDIRGVKQKFETWIKREELVPPPASPHAAFEVQNGWYVNDEKIVDEKVRWEVFPLHHDRDGRNSRLLIANIVLQAMDRDVVLKGEWEKGYGGFGIRFAPRKETFISTSAGPHDLDGLMLRHRYVDFSARFEGSEAESGVTLLVPSDHPDYPPAWILRHYGYIGVCWPGMEEYTLKKDEPLELEYWMFVHEGKGEIAGLQERLHEEFQMRLRTERE